MGRPAPAGTPVPGPGRFGSWRGFCGAAGAAAHRARHAPPFGDVDDVAVFEPVGHARAHALPLGGATGALEAHLAPLLAHDDFHVGLARVADDGDAVVAAGLRLHHHGGQQGDDEHEEHVHQVDSREHGIVVILGQDAQVAQTHCATPRSLRTASSSASSQRRRTEYTTSPTDAAASASTTPAKAPLNTASACWPLPAATFCSAGPSGIMVAISPSMGDRRLSRRTGSTWRTNCSSSSSIESPGATRSERERGLRQRCQASISVAPPAQSAYTKASPTSTSTGSSSNCATCEKPVSRTMFIPFLRWRAAPAGAAPATGPPRRGWRCSGRTPAPARGAWPHPGPRRGGAGTPGRRWPRRRPAAPSTAHAAR